MFRKIIWKILGIDMIQQELQQIKSFVGMIPTDKQTLSPRESVFLLYLKDYRLHSFSEIARFMGIKESTARMYYRQLGHKKYKFRTVKEGKKLLLGLPNSKSNRTNNR